MSRSVLTLAALLIAVWSAQAGVVIVQEADSLAGMGKATMTIKISEDRARVDMGSQISSIVDLKAGSVVSLMHPQKIAMELPKGALEAAKQKVAAHTDRPNLKPTGKKETINGFPCEEYVGTFQGLDVNYWVSKSVPHEKEILDQMAKLAGGNDPFKAALASGEDFPGFPIRTTVKSPQIGSTTLTVLSIKEEDIPDSDFKIPSGYKPMAVPQMSKPAGGGAAIPAGPSGQ
jgi:hypothetical protein